MRFFKWILFWIMNVWKKFWIFYERFENFFFNAFFTRIYWPQRLRSLRPLFLWPSLLRTHFALPLRSSSVSDPSSEWNTISCTKKILHLSPEIESFKPRFKLPSVWNEGESEFCAQYTQSKGGLRHSWEFGFLPIILMPED
jgi:hypothetical protein